VLDLPVAADGVGIPWRVHELLADHQLGTLQSGPQSPDHYQIVAVA